jgi:hypothetical protein
MNSALRRQPAAAIAIFGAVVTLAAGCTARPSSTANAPTAPAASPAKVPSLIDPRWIGFDTSAPWNWTEIDRRIEVDFQQFGFRPIGETGHKHHGEGCGTNEPTAVVTVYLPGKFDATDALMGQPVDVGGHGGFLRAYGDKRPPIVKTDPFEDAILTWQYADNAWATVRGFTPAAASLDRMLELARAVRPDERTPARVPLSLRNVPAGMPLALIHDILEPIYDSDGEYDTRLDFAPCVDLEKAGLCGDTDEDSGWLGVFIYGRHASGHDPGDDEVAWKIGGKDGRYIHSTGWAAVQVQMGMSVEFNFTAPRGTQREPEFDNVLAGIQWATDPNDEATWPAVTDWATGTR